MLRNNLILLALLASLLPGSNAHEPPGPVTTCQDPDGEDVHDYLYSSPAGNLAGESLGFAGGWSVAAGAGDGNLQNCHADNWTVQPVLDDNGAACQALKSNPDHAPVWSLACAERDTGTRRNVADYDGELDHGWGSVVLAVDSGDGATWGSRVCHGMKGHHSQNIYAIEWPTGSGPAFTVASDERRTPPAPGPKGPRVDCGDGLIEPCDSTNPPWSTQSFPVNVVIDTINAQLYALFGPSGSGTTCNVNDCAERSPLDPGRGARFNPFGPTHLVTTCAPGIDGVLVVFIENDLDAPHFPLAGHVWTGTPPASSPIPLPRSPVGCDDGLDNDGDGARDYPHDPGCSSATDADEMNPAVACDDGMDNDGDGAIDHPRDPGCSSWTDGDERGSAACDDTLDNDADGASDYPNDPGCSGPGDASERGAIACDDGVDNDDDGATDAPADPGCSGVLDASERGITACDDGLDGDDDGATDYPSDPGCASQTDTSERGAAICDDGLDNDADGANDYPADPGCGSLADLSERNASVGCDDGMDNDADGASDYPNDPGCESRTDPDERGTAACDDGLDNDGDGATDAPADPGCTSPNDRDERNPLVACDDGIDNDQDGLTDHPADPGCASRTGASEQEITACNDGLDNDGDGATDFPADTGCRDANDPDEREPGHECDDGLDNDDDTLIDHPSDPGCSSPADPSERTIP